MRDLLADARTQLNQVFAGRPVILAGGVAAAATQPIEQLRGLGATRFLVLATGDGTGVLPEGADVVRDALFAPEVSEPEDVIESFRAEEQNIADPSSAVLDAVHRFDPESRGIVLVPPFLDVRALGDRRAFGARRSEWVALEDKTTIDELFDAADVPRPASTIVAAEPSALDRAATQLDRSSGTVWSADARDGFNGGGAYVRWVRDVGDRREAKARLLPHCNRIRVATFVEGVPCSIHGFVVDDGVAVFRPVELVTLRAPTAPRLRYCGCATYFDPPAATVEVMRGAAARLGEHLRARVVYRGAFTLDGIASADGWVATECNPRFGAGLGYVGTVLPEATLMMLHYAVVEGVADVPSADLAAVVRAAGDGRRWGGAWTTVTRRFDETSSFGLVGGVSGFRRARDTETPDATLHTGPSRSGGFVRLEPDATRTRSGPSIAPLAVAGFAFADQELALDLGPLNLPTVRSKSGAWSRICS